MLVLQLQALQATAQSLVVELCSLTAFVPQSAVATFSNSNKLTMFQDDSQRHSPFKSFVSSIPTYKLSVCQPTCKRYMSPVKRQSYFA